MFLSTQSDDVDLTTDAPPERVLEMPEDWADKVRLTGIGFGTAGPLAVVPSRLPALWAKVIVLAGLVLPVTMLCAFVDFFAATAIVSFRGGSVISLTDPGVLRTVVGSLLYLTVVVVIGLALGAGDGARVRRPRPAHGHSALRRGPPNR